VEPKCAYHIGCHCCLTNWKELQADCDRFLTARDAGATELMVKTAKSLRDFAQVFLSSTDNTKE